MNNSFYCSAGKHGLSLNIIIGAMRVFVDNALNCLNVFRIDFGYRASRPWVICNFQVSLTEQLCIFLNSWIRYSFYSTSCFDFVMDDSGTEAKNYACFYVKPIRLLSILENLKFIINLVN